MPSPFDAIRKLLGQAAPLSAADAAAGLAKADALESELRGIIVKLSPTAADIMLDDAARTKARQGIADAEQRLADVAIARTRLEAAHAEALAASEDARRRAIYSATAAQLGKPGTLADAYDKAARATLVAVRAMAAMSLEVAEANASLPADVEPLLDPFESFALASRGFISPGLPREVVSERQVKLWCFADSWRPIGDQQRVVDGGKGRGYVPADSGMTAGNISVERLTFLEVTALPETANQWADPYTASNLALPGLYASPAGAYAPSDAASFIAAIDAALAAEAGPPSKRQPVIELYPVTSDGERAA